MGAGGHRHKDGLQIGGKAGVRQGYDAAHPLQARGSGQADRLRVGRDAAAGPAQRRQRRRQMLRAGENGDLPAGHGGRSQIGGRLDAVRQNGMAAAGQLPAALYQQGAVGVGFDPGAASLQIRDKVGDFRFPGRAGDGGFPRCARRGDQQIFGGADTGIGQPHGRAVQPVGSGAAQGVALFFDDRTHLPHRQQVQVDGTPAQRAAARPAERHKAAPRQHPAQKQDGRPHGPHPLNGDIPTALIGTGEGKGALLPVDRDPQMAQNVAADCHIAERGAIFDDRAAAQHHRRKNGQHRIFGAVRRYRPGQSVSPYDLIRPHAGIAPPQVFQPFGSSGASYALAAKGVKRQAPGLIFCGFGTI